MKRLLTSAIVPSLARRPRVQVQRPARFYRHLAEVDVLGPPAVVVE